MRLVSRIAVLSLTMPKHISPALLVSKAVSYWANSKSVKPFISCEFCRHFQTYNSQADKIKQLKASMSFNKSYIFCSRKIIHLTLFRCSGYHFDPPLPFSLYWRHGFWFGLENFSRIGLIKVLRSEKLKNVDLFSNLLLNPFYIVSLSSFAVLIDVMLIVVINQSHSRVCIHNNYNLILY